jgi:flagellar hook-length control protein FliK
MTPSLSNNAKTLTANEAGTPATNRLVLSTASADVNTSFRQAMRAADSSSPVMSNGTHALSPAVPDKPSTSGESSEAITARGVDAPSDDTTKPMRMLARKPLPTRHAANEPRREAAASSDDALDSMQAAEILRLIGDARDTNGTGNSKTDTENAKDALIASDGINITQPQFVASAPLSESRTPAFVQRDLNTQNIAASNSNNQAADAGVFLPQDQLMPETPHQTRRFGQSAAEARDISAHASGEPTALMAALTNDASHDEIKSSGVVGIGNLKPSLSGIFTSDFTNLASSLTAPPTALPTTASMFSTKPNDAALSTYIGTPVGQPGWAGEVSNAVIKLISRDMAEAKLSLNPENLGPIEVALDVSGNNIAAHFVASTTEAKQALEQSLPQLARMLEDAGMSLGQTSVDQGSRDQARQRFTDGGQHSGYTARGQDAVPAGAIATDVPNAAHIRPLRIGGVDTFA